MLRLLLLLISPTVSAFSGYAYQTINSNQEHTENSNRAAVNFDYNLTDEAELVGQFSTNELTPVTRLNLDATKFINESTHIGGKIGRFGKPDGFWTHVSDSPAIAGVNQLPQSTYDKRFSTSISTLTGVMGYGQWANDDIRLWGSVSAGQPIMSEQATLQKVMLDSTDYVDNIEIKPGYDSFAVNLSLDITDYCKTFYEYSHYEADIVKIKDGDNFFDSLAVDSIASIEEVDLIVHRLGLKAKWGKLTVYNEYSDTEFSIEDIGSRNWYALGSYPVTDYSRLFAGYSNSKAKVSGKWHNQEYMTGVHTDWGDWFTVLELRRTTGTSFTVSKEDENNISLSVGYRF